jgi:hypothetical protein
LQNPNETSLNSYGLVSKRLPGLQKVRIAIICRDV